MSEMLRFSISISIRSLQIVGIYPIKSHSKIFDKIQSFWGYFIFSWFVTFNITEFIEMYYIWGDLAEMTDNATVSLLYLVGVSKIYILIGMKPILNKMTDFVFQKETKLWEERHEKPDLYHLFKEYSQRSRNITHFFYSLTFTTILLCFWIPQIEVYFSGPKYIKFPNGTLSDVVKKPLIFSSWFPFDSNAPVWHRVANGLQVISGAFYGNLKLLVKWKSQILSKSWWELCQYKVKCLRKIPFIF